MVEEGHVWWGPARQGVNGRVVSVTEGVCMAGGHTWGAWGCMVRGVHSRGEDYILHIFIKKVMNRNCVISLKLWRFIV